MTFVLALSDAWDRWKRLFEGVHGFQGGEFPEIAVVGVEGSHAVGLQDGGQDRVGHHGPSQAEILHEPGQDVPGFGRGRERPRGRVLNNFLDVTDGRRGRKRRRENIHMGG